ncbi:MAG: hypothetical protein ACXWF8_05350 [Methylobacter sp.]
MNNYKVIIRGVQKGANIDQVIEKLSTLFKSTPDKIRPLIISKNLVVKKSTDFQTAEKYKKALTKVGCIVEVEPKLDSDELDLVYVNKSPVNSPSVNTKKNNEIKKCLSCNTNNPVIASFCAECGASFANNSSNRERFENGENLNQEEDPLIITIAWSLVVIFILMLIVFTAHVILRDRNEPNPKPDEVGEYISNKELNKINEVYVSQVHYTYDSEPAVIMTEIVSDLWKISHYYDSIKTVCLSVTIDGYDKYGNKLSNNIGTFVADSEMLAIIRQYKSESFLHKDRGATEIFVPLFSFIRNPESPYYNSAPPYNVKCPTK